MVIAGDTIANQKTLLYQGGYYPLVQSKVFKLPVLDPQLLIADKVKKSLHTNPNITKTKLEKLLSNYIADSLAYENVQVRIHDVPNIISFEPQTIKIEQGSFKSVTFMIDPEIQTELLDALTNNEDSNFMEELKESLGTLEKEVERLLNPLPPEDLREILDSSLEKIFNSAAYRSPDSKNITNQETPLYEYLRLLQDLKINCDDNNGGAFDEAGSASDSAEFTLPTLTIENPHAKILEKRDELIELLDETLVEKLENHLGFAIEDLSTINWLGLEKLNADLLFQTLTYIQAKNKSAI